MRLLVGSEFALEDGPKLVLLVEDREGYTSLCRLITRGRRRSAKGEYRLLREDLAWRDGRLLPAPGPGVGYAWDEEALRRYRL